MAKFIKLTESTVLRPILINLDRVECFVKRVDGLTNVCSFRYEDGEPAFWVVKETVEEIDALIGGE